MMDRVRDNKILTTESAIHQAILIQTTTTQ